AFGGLRTKSEKMADGVDEFRAVHRVKVKLGYAPVDEIEDLLGGDGGGYELARFGILVEAFEAPDQRVRHTRSRLFGEIRNGLERMYRHDAGNNGKLDSGAADALDIAFEYIVVEEELRNGAIGARVDLGLQNVDIGLEAAAFRMDFGIARNRDLECADAFQAG